MDNILWALSYAVPYNDVRAVCNVHALTEDMLNAFRIWFAVAINK